MENVDVQARRLVPAEAPVEGGSWTAASVGTAVQAACRSRARSCSQLARRRSTTRRSPMPTLDDVDFADGRIRLTGDPTRAVADRRGDAQRQGRRDRGGGSRSLRRRSAVRYFALHALGGLRRGEGRRGFGTSASPASSARSPAGRILNPKTARSQILGGVVWGIGMALHEESVLDHALGRFMNHNLAEYHVPVNADVHDIEVIFVEEHDDRSSTRSASRAWARSASSA